MIRVYVVDVDEASCQATRALLDSSAGVVCVGSSMCTSEALEKIESAEADIVLVEPGDTSFGGLELIAAIRRATAGSTRVLAYSTHEEIEGFEDAFDAGASGYLMKTTSVVVLSHVLLHVADGGSFLSPRATQHVLKEMGSLALEHDPAEYGLSDTEQRVLELHGLRHTPEEIAETLAIDLESVEAHLAALQQKTGARTQWELKCRVCQYGDCVIIPGEEPEAVAGIDVAGRGMEPCKHRNSDTSSQGPAVN